MQYFLKNKFGVFKQISKIYTMRQIFSAFHKTKFTEYKTRNPEASGFPVARVNIL